MQEYRNYPREYEFLSKFPSIRFIIKIKEIETAGGKFVSIKKFEMAHIVDSLGLLLPRGNKTDLVFEEIACRYAANNAVEKTQNSGEKKRRFETRSERFRHRRCSLGILRESPLGQLYGKTAHTDRPICELR